MGHLGVYRRVILKREDIIIIIIIIYYYYYYHHHDHDHDHHHYHDKFYLTSEGRVVGACERGIGCFH